MIPLLSLIKEAWAHRALILAVAVVGLLAVAKRQQETIGALRSRPAVEFRDRVVEKRVVLRGPVRVVKEVVKAPDGTETTRTVTDRSPETVTTDKDREKERTETPPQVASVNPYRYIGLALTPLDWKRPRVSAGFTLWRHVDAGAYWDTSRRLNDGALGAEARARF